MPKQDYSDDCWSKRFEEARKIKTELKPIVRWAQSVDQAPHAYLATIFRKDKNLPIDMAILAIAISWLPLWVLYLALANFPQGQDLLNHLKSDFRAALIFFVMLVGLCIVATVVATTLLAAWHLPRVARAFSGRKHQPSFIRLTDPEFTQITQITRPAVVVAIVTPLALLMTPIMTAMPAPILPLDVAMIFFVMLVGLCIVATVVATTLLAAWHLPRVAPAFSERKHHPSFVRLTDLAQITRPAVILAIATPLALLITPIMAAMPEPILPLDVPILKAIFNKSVLAFILSIGILGAVACVTISISAHFALHTVAASLVIAVAALTVLIVIALCPTYWTSSDFLDGNRRYSDRRMLAPCFPRLHLPSVYSSSCRCIAPSAGLAFSYHPKFCRPPRAKFCRQSRPPTSRAVGLRRLRRNHGICFAAATDMDESCGRRPVQSGL